ncbi:FAD/FMN-containing dehydrogenase [Kitasatospora sp. MAP12-15]|uniref:FAD-binding oxidoreductase n=1 Tax=unclassified Kitasatospora TaxID=2633591 RepID=UPI0024737019|nr:FAD-binding oxidoreductase [Kitasatospora sp. MAP12-44]MDH6113988.1 FAD/FMN-containing dehydrogenase [Kitasatospora sp. MAP12-44]
MTQPTQPTDLPAALAALRSALGPSGVLDPSDPAAGFVRDERGLLPAHPAAVLRPRDTAQVAAAVRVCARYGVPVVPFAGGTGLVGGAMPLGTGEQVVLSVRALDRIRSVDPADFALTAEAGCIVADVQQAAAEAGLLFPLRLASEGSCRIGGTIATNAGGSNVLRYGMTRDLVLGLEAVLPDGRIWHGLRALRKDNSGYDLKQLLIGSEGTLGIVTAATLRLFPLPRHRAVALLALPDLAVLTELLSCARELLEDKLTALELFTRIGLDLLIDQVPGTKDPFGAPHPAYLLVEATATRDADGLAALLERFLTEASERGLVADAVPALDRPQAQALWRLRESLPEAEKRAGGAIKHDLGVPLGAIADFIMAAERRLAERHPELTVNAFGHVGDGGVHFNVLLREGIDRAEISALLFELVAEFGGSISGEHGIGVLKADALPGTRSPVELSLLRAVKAALDPQGIMNPGKLLT